MKIGINEYGLVERFDSETVHIVLPDKNGGRPEYAGISDQIQLDWPMVSGDVIQCQMAQNPSKKSIYPLVVQTVSGLNGLDEKDATVRPMPRSNRHYAERISPSKSFLDSLSQHDIALRMIEYRCPMAFGNSVVIAGPHGAGSTQLLMKIMSHFQSTH